AERAAAVLFTDGIATLDLGALEAALADAPSTGVGREELAGGSLGLIDALVRTGLAPSRGAARGFVSRGAVYLNGRREAAERPLGLGDALHGRFVVLRRGKASQHVLAVED
ncbi:MAG: S4 domain-containing protein, partial [Acidimicrobiales bacterium]